ncbi:MAG TPA: GNAT family N-acetyltransferase [Methylomirabilota bacterium]|nr:GNAT family N-acetyltransferase [Methylomirabilota bacterium]
MARWDDFVAAHHLGTVYHLSHWQAALRQSFRHMEPRVLALRKARGGAIVGGLPVCTVSSRILGRRLVSVPFATHCDPLVSGEGQLRELMAVLRAEVKQLAADYLELRHRRLPPFEAGGWVAAPRLYKHHELHLDCELAEIWPKLSRTAIRRMVGKAEKRGIQVRVGDSECDLRTFYDLFFASRRRLELPPIPYDFFRALWQCLPAKMRSVLVAYDGEEPVAAVLGLSFKRSFFLEYSGERPGGSPEGSNQLLYWEAIKHAHREGCRTFSFGRTAPSNAGLLAYKAHWGAVAEDLTVVAYSEQSRRQRPDTETSFAHKVVRLAAQTAPDPVYRWLGRFCYSHWG